MDDDDDEEDEEGASSTMGGDEALDGLDGGVAVLAPFVVMVDGRRVVNNSSCWSSSSIATQIVATQVAGSGGPRSILACASFFLGGEMFWRGRLGGVGGAAPPAPVFESPASHAICTGERRAKTYWWREVSSRLLLLGSTKRTKDRPTRHTKKDESSKLKSTKHKRGMVATICHNHHHHPNSRLCLAESRDENKGKDVTKIGEGLMI